MIQPIPLSLLIHEVIYEEYLGNPNGLGEEYKDPIKLENVRVEAVTGRGSKSNSMISEENNDQYTMYYDVYHSTPSVNIVEKSKIIFNGQRLTVTKPNPIYAFSLHHYEAGLS